MSTVLHRRILSLPRSYARQYTTSESPSPSVTPRRNPPHTATQPQARREAHVRSRRSRSHVPTQPQTRHEAHEGTTALNVPFNPPGGGPGANTPGGGGALTFTRSPFLDAMLTTAIGLGAGKSIAQYTWIFLLSIVYLSLHWRRRLRQMVQDKRLE
jgi:hypothetical protein